jgi:hypothetical protein
MQKQNRSSNDLSIFQQMEMARWLSLFPALTVMIVLRRNLGYRILNPLWLFGIAAVMFVVGEVARQTPNAEALHLFAGLIIALGLVERGRRWWQVRNGLVMHSYYLGDSRLEYGWLPAFLRRSRRLARFLDPLIAFATGAAVMSLSPVLGLWLLFSGASLRLIESTAHRRQIERDFDTVDSLVDACSQARAANRLRGEGRGAQAGYDPIPTGLAPDLDLAIARKKRRP